MFAMADDKDEEGGFAAQKITIGVCVMEKKVKCGYEVKSFVFSLFLSLLILCFS